MEGLRGNWTRSIRWKVIVSSRRLRRLSASLSFVAQVGSIVHELEADVGQVERLAGVGEVDCCIHLGLRVCCEMDKDD